MVEKRLFVGNLPHDVNEHDIEKKFMKYGKVVSVEKKQRFGPENEVMATFAFITLQANKKQLDECLKTVRATSWKGHILKLDFAKESFLNKLKREREEISGNKSVNDEIPPKKKEKKKEKVKISHNNESESAQENGYSSEASIGKDRGLKMFQGTKGNSFQETKSVTKIKLNHKDRQVMKTFEDFSHVWRDDYEFQNVGNGTSFDELNESSNNTVEKEPHRSKWFPKLSKIQIDNGTSKGTNIEISQLDGDLKQNDVMVKNKRESSTRRNSVCTSAINPIQLNNNNFDIDVKSRLAEEKRMKAFEEKRQLMSKQKNVVKMALAGIDKKEKPNTKIIFDESEKEENDFEDSVETLTNKNQQKKSLFDDESGDEETNFKINQQFEGSKGQKLLALQSRYAHDDRFALDSRFIDSDEESIVEKEPESKSEKEKQLEILEQVVGFQVRKPENTKKKSSKETNTDTMLLRFDPTRSEHNQFIVQSSKAVNKTDVVDKKKRKKADKNIGIEETKVPEVSKETFFKVGEKIKDSLQTNQDSGFSLRKLFGSRESDESDIERPDDVSHNPASLPTKRLRQSNPFRYDSSDTESEDEEDKSMQISKPTPQSTLLQPFFFQDNDPRFEELKDFFGKQEMVNEEEFSQKRKELKRILHHRQMNKKQKNRPFQKHIGGARKKIVKKTFNSSNKLNHRNRTKSKHYK